MIFGNDSTPALSFRLLGFDVRVRVAFFVTSLVMASARGDYDAVAVASWVAVVFVSVLWHELGHALAARRFGAEARIELYAGGGLTHHAAVDAWWKDVVIAIAGPFFGFLLGAIFWLVARTSLANAPSVMRICDMGTYVSFGWGALNLVPVVPYDGGLALRSTLVRFFENGKAIALYVSLGVAVVGGVYALWDRHLWLAYLAFYGAYVARRELVALRVDAKLASAWQAWVDGELDASERSAGDVLRMSGVAPRKHAEAVERIAWVALARGSPADARASIERAADPEGVSSAFWGALLLLEGEPARAQERLAIAPPSHLWMWSALLAAWIARREPRLRFLTERLVTREVVAILPENTLNRMTAALFYASDFELSAAIGTVAFDVTHRADDAYNVACCEAKRERYPQAMEWLERAVQAGFTDAALLASDPDLGQVRGEPGFAALLARVDAARTSTE